MLAGDVKITCLGRWMAEWNPAHALVFDRRGTIGIGDDLVAAARTQARRRVIGAAVLLAAAGAEIVGLVLAGRRVDAANRRAARVRPSSPATSGALAGNSACACSTPARRPSTRARASCSST